MKASIVLLVSVLGGAFAVDTTCSSCSKMLLSASGGLQNEWSRWFDGHWSYKGQWNGSAFYDCHECQGSEDKLIFNHDAWMIVDCFPDADTACGSAYHVLLESDYVSPSGAAESCPYLNQESLQPWTYCDGNLATNGICEHYAVDDTVRFDCTDIN